MRNLRSASAWAASLCALTAASVTVAAGSARKPAAVPAPDFNREVRPILARHCFKCHGPDEAQRQGKLRLDLRAAALQPAATGRVALAPGKPAQSELVRRIHLSGGGVMPPASTKTSLSAEEKSVLKRWVAAGAEYKQHWAFVPPKQAPLPAVRTKGWVRNPVDTFVLARLEAAGLKPSPEADRYTLVRRLYLDLIGLPPTPEEADGFVNSKGPDAYEKLVDELLASPRYGERWARRWLDLARYADTNGYEKDRPRSIWPYRDWVINALNADMPFDQFTVEQIAGDMLPNATPAQRIATGFHRNTMLNEEGGIDPLEFRFHSMTDRVATTGTTWLGLTVGCAQCHTHKYDPITHNEYYQFFAFLNNADEPEMAVPQPDVAAERAQMLRRIAQAEATLAERFPPEGEIQWFTGKIGEVTVASGSLAERLADGSIRLSGAVPATDTYTVSVDTDDPAFTGIRLEALTDPSLGGNGPGRTPHGNFVLSELSVTVAPRDTPGSPQPVQLVRPVADFSQDTFPILNAIDGNPLTGWAIHGPGNFNVNRTATFELEKEPSFSGPARWTFKLSQLHGTQHTLGRFRLSLGRRTNDGRALEVRRKEHLEKKFAQWQRQEGERAVRWTVLQPVSAKSNLPLLTIQPDGSVLSSGDQTKRDVYDVSYKTDLKGVTAIRLEALPDESLPKGGPGRIYYEGPHGDFHLSELFLKVNGQPVKLTSASQTFGSRAQSALDGNPQTGWSVNGGQGQAHVAVFNLAEPLPTGGELALSMLFERYFAAGLGRFRLSVTTDATPEARLPAQVEEALLLPVAQRTPEQQNRVFRHYLSVAPELEAQRAGIEQLRKDMPALPTTLVFTERPNSNPRLTYLHKRGEFLQPANRVEAAVPAVLHPLDNGLPRNRLGFARWLVSPNNPLVGRVTMNRQWQAFFGQGIVRTTEDFGFQGDPPTHPELLDWLAVELRKQGWSMKKMHRLIVTSATYRQSSRVTPALLVKDPQNKLLSRGPRFRVEAEMLRDLALKTSGLLSEKVGGPSVFPPQPPGVTFEGAYGPLNWVVSTGEDRYRRGMYTFSKRTAPYAQFQTFDAPSGEACVARREVTNTPLQALTLLNDAVFVEASQELGRMLVDRPGTLEERAAHLFRRCVTRPPSAEELILLVRFYQTQHARLTRKELDAVAIAGSGGDDAADRAAWTLLARSLLNLDETVVKR